MAELDKGAASVYIGVDQCYQNYASETEMPIVTPREVEALVANGTLEVITAEDADGLDNAGVITGSGEDENLVPVVSETASADGVLLISTDQVPVVATETIGQQGPDFTDF